jgi:hypothetical protein
MGEDDYIAQMAPDQAGDVYGWCGLCHAFTEFPHNCPGEDHQVDEEAA